MERSIREIACEIRKTWPDVHYSAKPYLDAMMTLWSFKDIYGVEPATHIVAGFLSNAATWRGEDARRIKAELKAETFYNRSAWQLHQLQVQ